MAKHLVIVESPAKAKTINKLLGPDYVVKASMGHIRDLPQKKLGVDVENDFETEYVVIRGRNKILKELKDEAKKCDKIYLAPDPDREGEAIAWHLYEVLKKEKGIKDEQFFRVFYNEITKDAITDAFSKPGRIDFNKVNSQQARRVLDRLVGYKVSPLLWRRIKGGSSAGRVQSVALRLVCEKEKEIMDFNPEEYWNLSADLRKQIDPKDLFTVKLVKINDKNVEINTVDRANEVKDTLDKCNLSVARQVRKEIKRKAKPPFITSSLQQGASSFYSYTPKRTMSIAQKLYEAGRITYMRTDSFRIAPSAIESCADFIKANYGAEYIPSKPNFYKSRGAAQEAHEAIRPTDVSQAPEVLRPEMQEDEYKLYKLIWSRFVASQMVPAVIDRLTVEIENDCNTSKDKFLFRATTSEIKFAGYMKATGIEAATTKPSAKNEDNPDENIEVDKLPKFVDGENLDSEEFHCDQKFTKPPARFTEASLIRSLEENGVGRPSTYAQTLSTLDQRAYVEKENRSLKPTDAGLRVHEFLVDNPDYPKLNNLFNVTFTANMEEQLDKIEKGLIEWTAMIGEFYASLAQGIKPPEADKNFTKKVLGVLNNVKKWAEPVKQGRRTYDDNKMFNELKEKFDNDENVSKRQADALFSIACKYEEQIPDFNKFVEENKMDRAYKEAKIKTAPPKEETVEKLNLMETIEYAEPRKVGKKTYDDKKFVKSLKDQVDSGRCLSENQILYLHRLILKYKDQINDFETKSKTLGIEEATKGVEDPSIGILLRLLDVVTVWNPPVMRGLREFNDQSFYESLDSQYKSKGSLSPRQLAALKKMIARYGTIIQNYEALQEEYLLPPAKPPKLPKDPNDVKPKAKKKPAAKKKTAAKKKPAAKKTTAKKSVKKVVKKEE